MDDGKKRFMFMLVNFLNSVGWSHDQIEKEMHEWNKRNKEQLRETLIVGQLRYNKQVKKKILPPNCANGMYYKDMHICFPDGLCEKIKNPVNYSKRKIYFFNRVKDEEAKKQKPAKPKKSKKKSEEIKKSEEPSETTKEN